MENEESFSLNFEFFGYESRYIARNMGPLFYFVAGVPIYMLLIT